MSSEALFFEVAAVQKAFSSWVFGGCCMAEGPWRENFFPWFEVAVGRLFLFWEGETRESFEGGRPSIPFSHGDSFRRVRAG